MSNLIKSDDFVCVVIADTSLKEITQSNDLIFFVFIVFSFFLFLFVHFKSETSLVTEK